MANIKYAYNEEDDSKKARAMGKSLKISPKHSVEICRELRGMGVETAKKLLR
jgi:large subunit ribosomal protein L22